jgi:hypothetical protein
VTPRVTSALKPGMTSDQASTARNAAIAAIEKESKDKTGLRSDVVTLYQGGAYHLYRYKRYDDVRLVFAPEQQMAFFGGDPITSNIPDTISISAFSGCTKMASQQRSSTFLNSIPMGRVMANSFS